MKNLTLVVAAIVAASFLSAEPAYAIKPFADAFVEKYNLKEPKTDEQKALAAEVKEAKCALCHAPKDKKVRNDYGEALDELLDKGDYSSKRRKDEPEEVQKELFAALEKVEKGKSKEGGTYGERIKAGKLPGKMLEE